MKTLTLITALLLSITLYSQQRSRTYWDNANHTIKPATKPLPSGMNSADQKISLDTIHHDYFDVDPNIILSNPYNITTDIPLYHYNNITPPKYELVCYGDSVMIVDGIIKKYDKNYIQYYGGSAKILTIPNNKAIAEPYREIKLSDIGAGEQSEIKGISLGTGLILSEPDTIPNAICVATGWSMGTLSGRTLVSYESQTGIGTISGLDRYGNVDRRNIREQTTALLRQKGIKKIIINLDK